MRIIKIEIENINSLKGKWTIDFSDKSYEENYNQFVISGATGSGKTTILDAICLALYGKTPREQSVNNANNELMCKTEGYCMAAVTYECSKGKFRSSFYQQRARRNPNGILQRAECTIENVEDGTAVVSKKVASSIEEVIKNLIGLDYSQFCRSIILAQGSFDKFLRGDEREKAEILAKLNGTEHYKEVGVKIHEKATEINRELQSKENELNSIQVLSVERINELKNELEAIEKSLKNSDLEELEKKHRWKEEYEQKERALKEAERNKESFTQRKQDFKNNETRLEIANRANACETSYVQYNNLEDELKKRKETLNVTSSGLEDAKEKEKIARENNENAKNLYNKKLEEQNKNNDLWINVRTIDLSIKNKEENCEDHKRRLKDAKEELESKRKLIEDSNKIITSNKSKIAEIDDYLNSHAIDDILEQKIVFFKGKRDDLENQISTIKDDKNNLKALEKELEELKQDKEEVSKLLNEANDKLKQLISDNYKEVSLVLRNVSLHEGKPCPVCGSLEHPFVQDNCIINEQNKSENSAVVKVMELSNIVEKKQESLNVYQKKIDVKEVTLTGLRKNAEEHQEKLRTLINEVNTNLKPWSLSLDESDINTSIDNVIENLEKLSSDYKKNKSDKENLINENSKKEASISTINLKALDDSYNNEQKTYEKITKELEKIKKERIELFGDKNVDEIEKTFNKELEEKRRAQEKSSEVLNNAEQILERAKTNNENANEEFKKTKTSLEIAQENLSEKLKQNNFSSIADFLSGRIEERERNLLNQERENLLQEEASINTSYENALNVFQSHKKQELTEESKEELAKKIEEIKKEQESLNQRKGTIAEILRTNDENEENRKLKEGEYQDIKEKNDIYDKLTSMIGVRSGRDLEVFVQRLAMENLLVHTNEYLSQILPDYKLLQKDNTMDCILHDINYDDDKYDRPTTNLSGGETFAVSLSFALAIAQISSDRVQMNSLFLDEGFGTLSGEPLVEAINALKKLRNNGKMLGIITHVDTVIEAFDQKIKAKKVRGYSVLEGPGIQHN